MPQLPVKLNTKRSHRIIQFFLERSKGWSKENRDFSIYWSTSHMTTTAHMMRLLAVARGLEPDICAIAGAIHDIATMETGKADNHAARALDFIAPLIKEYNESRHAKDDSLKITQAEIALLERMIPLHSEKDIFSDDIYVETLKDADAIDRYLQGVEVKQSEMPRLVKAFGALGIHIGSKKPEFLFHGSPYYFETLIPKQAKDNTERGSQLAVYACERFDEVIPFALPIRWYPDNPSGKRDFSCKDGMTVIHYGSIDPTGAGYVYKISSEHFNKIDDWQWTAAREITPIEVTKIFVKDYWHTISFSDEALEINKQLYPAPRDGTTNMYIKKEAIQK